MIIISLASAAPVICDPDQAQRLVDDAGIEPARIPAIQPNLLPGLARAGSSPAVREVIDRLCGDGTGVSLVASERWEGGGRAAYTFILTRSHTQDCVLEQEAVALTVGVEGEDLHVGVRSRLPPTVTPIGDCEVTPRFQEERVIAGADTTVRVVLVSSHIGDEVEYRLVARRVTPEGWHEQTLLDPAPPRYHGGVSGPLISVLPGDDRWIVAHGNRQMRARCEPVPSQVVWRWADTHWVKMEGREALGRLADRGAWRLAGQDGWFLIVAQDRISDRDVLIARTRRLQRHTADVLHLRSSADFPKLNAGYLVVSPDPWPTESEAKQAKKRWGRRTGAYVKQAWAAVDACSDITSTAETALDDGP